MKADFIVKGTIYTGNDNEPLVEMIAVKDGKYCYVGAEEEQVEFQEEDTPVLQLANGMVMPGMFEGHAHVSSGIDLFNGVNLYGLNTPEQYLQAISEYIEEHPDREVIGGRGFLNGNFGHVGPTAAMLDQIAGDKCIILDSEDCHSSWVNSKVLQKAGIGEDTEEVENGVIVRYEGSTLPTGWLKEKAMDLVKKMLPSYGVKDYKQAILKFQDIALSYGVSCSYEPIMNDKKDIDLRIRAYQELEAENKLVMQFRAGITMNPEEDNLDTLNKVISYRETSTSSHFKVMGVKVFIDGVIEGHTAFLREAYADEPSDCSYSMWKQEKLNALFVKAAELDIPMHVHAIGDAAIDCALDAFDEAYLINGPKEMRNCITHLQVLAQDQYQRFQKLGIIAVTNPFWHYKNPSYYDCLEVPYLGKERADLEYPMNSFIEHGIVVTQASDWPVSVSFYPMIGLEIAVTRKEPGNSTMEPLNESEAVTVEQMIKVLTVNGAYQMQLENSLGSIEVGKKADFIIVDQNLLETAKEQLAMTKVVKHFIDGKEVYCSEVELESQLNFKD